MRYNGKLAEFFGESNVDQRFENWLFHTMRMKGFNPRRGSDSHTAMVDFLQAEKIAYETIRPEYNLWAVPEELLMWIGKDPWQHFWIENELSQVRIFHHQSIENRRRIILLIDAWMPISGNKIAEVKCLKEDWIRQMEKDKKYKWFFDDNKEEKLSILSDWVRKNMAGGEIENFVDTVDVLSFFNFKISAETAKLCFLEVKKRWSQAKYRSGLKRKKKQQYNAVLTDKSLKILDEMAEQYMLSRPQVLEILIRTEGQKKLYVAEWVRLAKSLE